MGREQETTQAVAWRGQAELHLLMSLAQREAGNVAEANRLANAGIMAALVAEQLERGGPQSDQALEAYQRRLGTK